MFTLSNELYSYHYNLPTTVDDVAAANGSSTGPVGSRSASGSTSFHANLNMDSIFFLGEGDRSTFLNMMMQYFGSTYICLWVYDQSNLPQTLFNFLRYMDGFYRERSDHDQPSSSSSSASFARVSFNEYQQSVFIVDHSRCVPGYALVNNIPYLELKSEDLLKLARAEPQRQFYQAAGIKTAVFMACNAGEIELGFSDQSQMNIEMEMRNWFPDDFSRQLIMANTTTTMTIRELHRPPQQPTDQNRPESASSSSLRSLSYDSPEYSVPFLQMGMSSSVNQPEPIVNPQLAAAAAAAAAALRPSPSIFTTSPPQSSIKSQIRNPQIPSIETEDAAMAKAILAVISSPTNNPNNPNINPNNNNSTPCSNYLSQNTYSTILRRKSAFKWYGSPSSSSTSSSSASRFRRQNMLKRSISFLRNINAMRSQSQEHNMQTGSGRTSTTQLHHMISERRRREKLNESFQALRSLLPPGTKKDKASVLTGTTDYLSSLKAEVEELSKRNAILEAQLQILPKKTVSGMGGKEAVNIDSRSESQSVVGITEVSESTSSSSTRIIDLHVMRVGENISINDMVVRLLEFLKRSDHHHSVMISLMSIEANTTLEESHSVNRIVLRLKIQGEWDQSAFQEAVRRVVNDQM